jgi:hypothetical protein
VSLLTKDFEGFNMGNNMLSVICAGVILFTAILSINRAILHNYNAISESGMLIISSSIGQEIIEEANGKFFDEVLSVNPSSDLPNNFTAPDSLGKEYGENYPVFDDIDDYNGLTKIISTSSGKCSIAVKVGYVDSTNVEQWVNQKGFYKKMEINVFNEVMPNPIKFSYLFCFRK